MFLENISAMGNAIGRRGPWWAILTLSVTLKCGKMTTSMRTDALLFNDYIEATALVELPLLDRLYT